MSVKFWWPSAKKLFDKMSKENEKNEDETKGENNEQMKDKIYSNFMETGIKCARQLRSFVSQIIDKHYDNAFNNKIDNFVNFNQVFQLDERLSEIIYNPANFINNSFFMDELKSLIAQSHHADGDLTKRYCNIKMFHYLRQYFSKEKWESFKKQFEKGQLLERAAIIVAQWFQPQKYVYYSCVNESLDNIVQEVLKCLKEKYPDHSIFWKPAENFSCWKNNNIIDNHWDEAEGTQIMDTLEEYIFGTLNFTPNKSTNVNLKFFCIDNNIL
ncbi:uncharacterized protein [Anoplolepis gracilipes]|uniref:uncharacterized protein n=1 Tax=Anoplolepis gracilipes TaxID=354296 RepID=UPI003BA1C81A